MEIEIEKVNNLIYRLRKNGWSYERIAKYLNDNNIASIKRSAVDKRCKKIFAEKGEKEPTDSGKIPVSREEIYYLKKMGLKDSKIALYYNNKGIDVSDETIRRRVNEIFKEKGVEVPTIKRTRKRKYEEVSDEEICRLKEKFKMSFQEIASYYNKRGINITTNAIQKRYNNFRGKGKSTETTESLANLNRQLNKKIKMLQETERERELLKEGGQNEQEEL